MSAVNSPRRRGQAVAKELAAMQAAAAQAPPATPPSAKRRRDNAVAAAANLEAENERQHYMQEIHRLRREVKDMEAELKALEQSDGDEAAAAAANMSQIMEHLLQASEQFLTSKQDVDPLLPVEDQGAFAKLQTMASVTGIRFSDATSQLEKSSQGQLLRRYRMAGECFGLTFSLGFAVQEESKSIESLEAIVPEAVANELQPLIQQAQQERSPQLFFRGFVQYARLHGERTALFKAVARARPDVVRLPQGYDSASVMRIDSPESIFNLVFSWSLRFGPRGRVQSYLSLASAPTLAARRADTDGTARAVTSAFDKLCRTRGVANALLTFIGGVAPLAKS